ncbi:MAG: preprotein translocase subunit YajC [Myxococcota bacterium]
MTGLGTAVLLQQEGAGQDYSFFVMMGAIFFIFYFLLIRPQQRRQKEHEQLLKSVEKGDTVVTSGGLHGKVTGTTDDVLTLEIAALQSGDRVRVKVQRGRIESVTKPGAKEEAKGGSKK